MCLQIKISSRVHRQTDRHTTAVPTQLKNTYLKGQVFDFPKWYIVDLQSPCSLELPRGTSCHPPSSLSGSLFLTFGREDIKLFVRETKDASSRVLSEGRTPARLHPTYAAALTWRQNLSRSCRRPACEGLGGREGREGGSRWGRGVGGRGKWAGSSL